MIIFKGTTHVFVALFIYTSLFGFDIGIALAIAFGSLFPDIDTRYSVLGRYNPFTFIMQHRGWTHTILGWIFFSCVAYIILEHLAWGFIYGYGMHLIMDTMTPMGIMWLYPFRKNYYSLFGRKKTPRKLRG